MIDEEATVQKIRAREHNVEQLNDEMTVRKDAFVPRTRFKQVIELAETDRRLRTLILEGVTLFELRLRVELAYRLGKNNPFSYREKEFFEPWFLEKGYLKWQKKFNDTIEEQQEKELKIITHHIRKYDGKVPIWAAVEVMDFGQI